MLTLQRQTGQYLTLANLFNVLFVSLALLEFYQLPDGQPNSLFAEAKKKKVLVVKHVGMGYKKVPVYKKVPYKILKVEIKKKKSKKPWKKWFKKQMIVKIPHEHHHGHHGHHHAASEGHQTWALPAFISTPSSMGEIMDAWPSDYSGANTDKQSTQTAQVAAATNSPAAAAVQATGPAPPTSISDLKSIGSEMYPAYLAEAAAQLVQASQFAFPQPAAAATPEQQQQQQDTDRANRLRSFLASDPSELTKHLLGLPSTVSNIVEMAPPPPPLSFSGAAAADQQQAAASMAASLAPLVQLSAFPIMNQEQHPVANASTQSQLKR